MKYNFVKMHGLGNDFVIFDFRAQTVNLSEEQIKIVCDRNFGVGCDQLIILKASNEADCEMVIYNHDGSKAEACGNATRCVAMLIGKEKINIKINKKILNAKFKDSDSITVNMGMPEFNWKEIPLSHEMDPLKIWISGVNCHAVSMGNPHIVIFVNSVDNYNVADLGPKLENYKFFPNKTNVNFAQIIDENTIKLRVWERGTGETIACGSGACATFAVARILKKIGSQAYINLKGGVLSIESGKDGSILMTGPATKVFDGEIDL